METDSGDIFCLNWNCATSTVYFGCQNTSIQWFSFESISGLPSSVSDGDSVHGRSVRSSSLERVLVESGLHSGTSTPRRVHKFFDSYPQYERKPADLNARNPCCSTSSTPPSPHLGASSSSISSSYDSCVLANNIVNGRTLQEYNVPPQNMIWSAHYGYVYCMALAPSSNREGSDDSPGLSADMRLITGSGDATVKVGRCSAQSCTML